MNLYFDKTYSGKKYSGGEWLYIEGEGGLFQGLSKSAGNYVQTEAVVLTGYYATSARGAKMLQIVGGKFIDLTDGDWRDAGMVYYSQREAQSVVDAMIENNKIIVQCNLFCARFAYRLTDDEKRTLYGLQMRLQQRNQRLSQDGLCSGLVTSTPAGYSKLESFLSSFMASGGVGIGLTATIIVSAVVIASLSTAAYFAYKYLYEQSKDDVRYSKQLTKVLQERLTPDEYEQLLKETQGIVTKAKVRQMVATTGGWLKWGLIASGAYLLYTQILEKKGRKNGRRKN